MIQVPNVQAAVKYILDTIAPLPQASSKKLVLPSNDLTEGELASVLAILAKSYNTTLPSLISTLDRVSGDLNDLDKFFKGNKNVEWTEEEDKLLVKNKSIFEKWKGAESTERRMKYLGFN